MKRLPMVRAQVYFLLGQPQNQKVIGSVTPDVTLAVERKMPDLLFWRLAAAVRRMIP